MPPTQENTSNTIADKAKATTESGPHVNKIDPNAPAGSENSLGAQSVRDGRPSSDSGVVEAMDEEAPGPLPEA